MKVETAPCMWNEASREVPIVNHCDVLACGGGPAGFASAILAARAGAKTLLVESQGCLGGGWTAGVLSHLLDPENKKGIFWN